jgi:hypothetical protein
MITIGGLIDLSFKFTEIAYDLEQFKYQPSEHYESDYPVIG